MCILNNYTIERNVATRITQNVKECSKSLWIYSSFIHNESRHLRANTVFANDDWRIDKSFLVLR